MNREQFMEQLSRLLWDIPEAERLEALDYYNSYFDDAGPENESAVIRELGSPGKVAAIIKADLRENAQDYGEFTERGFEDTRAKEEGQMPQKYGTETDEERKKRREERWGKYREPKSQSKFILILILLVFLAPILKGAVGGALGFLVTLLLLPFLVVFGVGAGALGLLIGGVVTVIAGIGVCMVNAAAGIFTIGIGSLLFAIGLVLLVAVVWLGGRTLPWIIRKITDFFYRVLHREGKGGAKE